MDHICCIYTHHAFGDAHTLCTHTYLKCRVGVLCRRRSPKITAAPKAVRRSQYKMLFHAFHFPKSLFKDPCTPVLMRTCVVFFPAWARAPLAEESRKFLRRDGSRSTCSLLPSLIWIFLIRSGARSFWVKRENARCRLIFSTTLIVLGNILTAWDRYGNEEINTQHLLTHQRGKTLSKQFNLRFKSLVLSIFVKSLKRKR